MLPSKLPSQEHFNVKDCVVGGDECVLVYPKKVVIEWNESNKWFRSSIWRQKDMSPVSLGFRRFSNFGETPTFEPLDLNQKLSFIKKVDGSCLIVSFYNGELIIRTRGTADATKLTNGGEIELLKAKYRRLFSGAIGEYFLHTHSLIFEWTTPSNRIVLKESDEPELWLIGAVRHEDYAYVSQDELDTAADLLKIRRPPRYNFNTFEEMKDAVTNFDGTEGVVIYSEDGQILKKIKGLKYLAAHRIMSDLRTTGQVAECFILNKCESIDAFREYCEASFDFEVVGQLGDDLKKVGAANDFFLGLVAKGREIAEEAKQLPTRREQAKLIEGALKKRAAFGFLALDGMEIPDKIKKDIFLEYIDESQTISAVSGKN